MIESWSNNSHDSYLYDPSYLENRFRARPLKSICIDPGVVGAARFIMLPSFSGESVTTLVYGETEIQVELRVAERSLWGSLTRGEWAPPVSRTFTKPLKDAPAPLNCWQTLKDAAQSAPSVEVAIIDGQQYHTRDGILYRHHVADSKSDAYAEWTNPTELASNHVAQVHLVRAYEKLIQSCDLDELPSTFG